MGKEKPAAVPIPSKETLFALSRKKEKGTTARRRGNLEVNTLNFRVKEKKGEKGKDFRVLAFQKKGISHVKKKEKTDSCQRRKKKEEDTIQMPGRHGKRQHDGKGSANISSDHRKRGVGKAKKGKKKDVLTYRRGGKKEKERHQPTTLMS